MTDTETTQGDLIASELLWIHESIRRDLASVRSLAADVVAGADPGEVRESLDTMRTNGPLWKLKVNCLQYCRFVHHHHQLEDAMMFPIVRDRRPETGTVIDRLEADHRKVAVLLDDVTDATGALDDESDSSARREAADALEALADHLTEHLAYEEEELLPVLRTLTAADFGR